ncbi:MAG: hypothetical protein ACRDU0_16645, partial [Mycobacterium sp.]
MQLSLGTDRQVHREPRGQSWLRQYRFDLLWGSIVVGLVLAAFIVPHLLLRWLVPVVNQTPAFYGILAQTAPLLGQWLPHASWATPVAVLIAAAVVGWGPSLARSLPWPCLVGGVWLVSTAWAMALALIDGWRRGFVSRMGSHEQYLSMVPRVHSVSGLLHGFAAHIPAGRPGSWDTDVAGHPVGALLTFVGLDRIGFGGPVWAGMFCVVVGSSSAAAVLITLKALDGEGTARLVAPFVALAPVAIWIAVSADAYYAGVAAWGLTLLALAATGTTRLTGWISVAAGALLG